jgi:transcriptional regulator with XRE-family HTH domain
MFTELWEDSVSAEKLVNVVESGLAGEILYIRDQRDLTLEAVCDQLGWQQSKLSRMERGQQCISAADLASLLVIYKVQGKERRRLLHLVDRQDEPGYWDFNSPLDAESKPLVRLEPQATALVSAETLVIPGLVQIPDYTCAVLKAAGVPHDHLGSRVESRRARKAILTRDNPPKLDLIVHEAALRQVMGSPKIMARQLRAMLEVAELPNVRLWVMPFELAGNAGLHFPLYLMKFPRDKSVVYLENWITGVYLEDPEKIELVRRRTAELARVALNPAESAARVALIAKDHDRH